MTTLLDPIIARVSAILGGAYPALPESPYVPLGTFTPGQVFLPNQNPEFPSGPSKAARDRLWDLVWTGLDFDPPGTVNGGLGPWVRRGAFELRIQYALTRPGPLAPRDRELALGALAIASQRAMDDLTAIEWAFMQPVAWTGAAICYTRSDPATVTQADAVRVVATLPGSILFEQSAAIAPTPWSTE
jgi:hypothetical protein